MNTGPIILVKSGVSKLVLEIASLRNPLYHRMNFEFIGAVVINSRNVK